MKKDREGRKVKILPKKRIIICCDGTWNDGVNSKKPLTNVSRIARCISHTESNGLSDPYRKQHIAQILYYGSGVGTGTGLLATVRDGMTGRGITANIRDAYTFICQNYNFHHEQDEIISIGFSRGAFTARCVASMINSIGLLTKRGLVHFPELYRHWRDQTNDELEDFNLSWKDQLLQESGKFSGKSLPASVKLAEYRDRLSTRDLRKGVPIKAVAVWDTVSALAAKRALPFVNERLETNIKYAFHALSLNEQRNNFKPTLWTCAESTILKQCWFLGDHSDVGGGHEDAGLANISLLWMISQLEKYAGVQFNDAYIRRVIRPMNVTTKWSGKEYDWQVRREESYSKYKGTIFDSLSGSSFYSVLYNFLGAKVRTPGRYPVQRIAQKQDTKFTVLSDDCAPDSEPSSIGEDECTGDKEEEPLSETVHLVEDLSDQADIRPMPSDALLSDPIQSGTQALSGGMPIGMDIFSGSEQSGSGSPLVDKDSRPSMAEILNTLMGGKSQPFPKEMLKVLMERLRREGFQPFPRKQLKSLMGDASQPSTRDVFKALREIYSPLPLRYLLSALMGNPQDLPGRTNREETIHFTVRVMLESGKWECTALNDYAINTITTDHSDHYVWQYRPETLWQRIRRQFPWARKRFELSEAAPHNGGTAEVDIEIAEDQLLPNEAIRLGIWTQFWKSCPWEPSNLDAIELRDFLRPRLLEGGLALGSEINANIDEDT